LGTGLFILLRPLAAPSALALPITVVANTALTLPFLYRLLLPQAKQIVENYARLSAALDLTGWAEMRLIILPLLARQLGYGAGLAAALSMGDLGVIALFADSNSATLPLLVQQLMGAYRMDQAAAAALVLVITSAALFFSLDRIGKYYADT
jgi:thiamine transport system permease protein